MKSYTVAQTPSSMLFRYSFMNLMADIACTAIMVGSIGIHCTPGKLSLLFILYNLLSVSPRCLFSVFSDRVVHRHTGVRLGVIVLFLGFVLPIDFGVTLKTVLMGLGNGIYRSFAGSSVAARSRFSAFDSGIFAAGSALGTAIGLYKQFIGFLALFFLALAAVGDDRNAGAAETDTLVREGKVNTLGRLSLLPVPVLMLVCTMLSYMNAVSSFSWNTDRKTAILIAMAAMAGRAVGGWLYDRFSVFSLLASLVGGGALLCFCPNAKILCLGGLLLLNMAVPVILLMLLRCLPRHPGFSLSLALSAGYLGYALSHLARSPFPSQKGMTVILTGLSLAVLLGTWLLFFRADRPADPSPGKEPEENEKEVP